MSSDKSYYVCSIKRGVASTAIEVAARARAMVSLLEANGEMILAEQLEQAFTNQFFVMAGKGSYALTIERKDCDGTTVWIYSLEQGFLDIRTDRQWVVPVSGSLINRRITI